MNKNTKTFSMETNRTRKETSSPVQPFNLVIIHDDHRAARFAENIVLRLLGKCLPSIDIHKDEWTSSELAHPEFAREATELAAGCDMLVIATAAPEGLSSEISSWVRPWLQTRSKMDTALVSMVLSRHRQSAAQSIHHYLEALAFQYGLCFFATTILDAPCETLTPGIGLSIAQLSTLCTPQPEGWGINE
jgi:hypothetical protein